MEREFNMRIVAKLFFSAVAFLVLLSLAPVCGDTQTYKTPVSLADVEFVSGQSARQIPFELIGNHIYLRAQVNDGQPVWLLLDTGATASYFDVQKAKALGLAGESESIKVTISFPGVRVHNQKFSLQPLTFGVYDGHAIDGLLGYDFINRFVVEINYISRTIDLNDPQRYHYTGSGHVLPLLMLEDDSVGKVPLVRARIIQHGRKPIDGKFIADIAVRNAINFNTPFVEKNKMLQATRKTIQAIVGGGAMVRESKQPLGRVPNIQLGLFTLKNSLAVFFQDKKGVLACPEFDGVIGAEFLRRFRVVFDYSRKQMILEGNRNFSEPYEYDMSGALLIAEGTEFKIFKVRQLIENSPATAAQLREGDVLSAIDGEPASKLTLEQVRQMFNKEGRSYLLSVKRGDEELQIRIRLRRLV
jgi:hypothetical protein